MFRSLFETNKKREEIAKKYEKTAEKVRENQEKRRGVFKSNLEKQADELCANFKKEIGPMIAELDVEMEELQSSSFLFLHQSKMTNKEFKKAALEEL